MLERQMTEMIAFAAGLSAAVAALQRGEVVAFPTDTVYGVGAAGLDGAAVAKLFAVKARPATQAIPLLLADAADLTQVCASVPPLALALAQRHWPGGLTLIVPAASHLPAELLAGGTTVAATVTVIFFFALNGLPKSV